MRLWSYETTMEKPVAGTFICLYCLNFHGKCLFLKAEIQRFSKLLEISCLQLMKSKLRIIPLCLTCFTHYRGVSINIFWYFCCSLLIFMAKKATEGTELQLQSHIQALLYIYNTDYMMSLITVHILHAPCICWQQWLRLLGQQIKK